MPVLNGARFAHESGKVSPRLSSLHQGVNTNMHGSGSTTEGMTACCST